MRNLFVALGFSALSFIGFSQNNCNSAVSLDPVPADALCPGSPTGSFTAPVSVTLGDVAGPSNPYTYVPDCDGTPGNDMELFANDLWFSFTATANILNVNMTNILGLTEANVGFYTGTCAQLIGLGCSVSGANPSTFSATLEPLTPGDTYYIQISGGATDPTTGSFDLAIANSLDCNDCLTGASLTVNPAPIAGTYQPGQVVDFCFTVTDYTQVSANWFHGVEIQLGSGWDQTVGTNGIVATATPASCSGSGVWGLYSSVTGVNGTYDQGFYYDYNGFPNGPGDGNPGNNFGDNNAELCDPQFCWQLTVATPAICNPASPPSLDVSVNTLADGESGSWTSLACTDDPLYTVNAIVSCCNPPTMASTAVSCPGVSDGSVTATIPGAEPTIDGIYYFSFYDEFGTLVYSTSVDNTGNAGNPVSATTPSTLPEGDYTVVVSNPVNCAATAIETIAPPAGAVTATVPADILECTGTTIGPLVFGVTPATPGYDFDWTMDTDIGAGTSGTGVTQIDAFTATNTGSTILVSTVTVTPTPIAAGCPGVPETFTITVNPAPVITLTPTPGTTVCAGEPVDLEACYTPAPLGVSTSFFEGTDVQIEWTGSGNGPETGSMSVTSTGIEPTTLSAGTLESICFTLSMQDPADIDYFTIEVNGVVYSSNATLPAGSTYNADLNTVFNTINTTPDNGNGQAPPVTVTYCMPQTFLDLIDATGGAANATWTFFTEFSLSGSNEAFIWDFEVVMLDVTPYTYNWSPTGTITAGSTSGDSFGECHTVTISTLVDETYTFDILDNTGCTGTATVDITVTPGPTATMTTGSAEYCEADVAATGIDIDVALTGIPDWTIVYDTDGNLGTTGDQVTVSGISTSPYTITNATAGTYQLVSVADQGCPGGAISGTYTVTENPTPILTVPADICAGGLANTSTTITADGTPASPTAWSIVGGTGSATLTNADQNTVTVTGTAAGTVILEYVNDNNCSEQVTVTVNPIPVPTATNGGPYCVGQTANLDGGPTTAGWTYNWTGPNTFNATEDPSISNVQTTDGGVYTLTVIDGNGCSANVTTNMVVNPLPTISGLADICAGGLSNTTVDLTGSGTPAAPTAWTITGGTGTATLTNDDQNVVTVTGTGAGTIDLEYTDNASCVATATITVDPIPVPTAANTGPYCVGDLIELNAEPTAQTSYAWTGPNTFSSATEDPTIASATTAMAGVYTVVVTDVNNCSDDATTTVVVNPLPVVTPVANFTVCSGITNNVNVSLTSDQDPNVTYSWTVANVGTDITGGSAGTGSTITQTLTNGGAGAQTIDYVVTATNTVTNCVSATMTFTVTVDPLPTITGVADICAGGLSNTSVDLTGSNTPAAPTAWTITGGTGTATLTNDDQNVVTVTGTGVGTIDLQYADANGCVATASLTVNPIPVPTATNTGPYCVGDLIELNAEPTAQTSYSWTGPNTFTSATEDPTIASATLAMAGDYTVVVTDVNNCSDQATTTVVINPLPTATIATDVTVCVGDAAPDITFTGANGTAPYTFTYNINGGANTTVVSNGAGVATVSAPTGTAGSFTYNLVSVSDNSVTACSQPQTGTATVTVDPLPTATIASDVTVCQGDPSPDITFTGANGTAPYTFTYTINGGANQTVASDGTGVATVAAPTGTAGTFTYDLVSVADNSTNACSQAQTGSAVVTVNPTPTATIATDVTVCVGDGSPDITFTGSNGTAPYTFTYNINGGANTTVVSDGTGVATVAAPTGTAGTFTYNLVSVADASATVCTATLTGTAVVTVNPLPTATIATDVTVCEGDASPDITFTGANGTAPYTFTYNINGGANTTVVSDGTGVATVAAPTGTAGTFTYNLVSVADNSATACSQAQTGSATVTVNPTPTATIASDATVCQDDPSVTVTITGSGGTIPYSFSYDINGGATQTVVSDGAGVATLTQVTTAAGTFTYNLTNVADASATACSQVLADAITVTVNPSPTISTVPTDPTVCNGTDGEIEVSGSSANPVTVSWTGPSSGSAAAVALPYDITGLPAGTYDVTYTDDVTGCSTTISVASLINPGAPILDIISDVANCDVNYTLPAITGTALNNPQYYDAPGGAGGGGNVVAVGTTYSATTNITLYAYDENGACFDEEPFTIVINPLPTATIAADVTVCVGDPSPNITLTGADGTAPYTFTYNINGGANQTVVSDGTGVATVSAPTGTAGSFAYNLVDVTDASSTACSQAQTGTATITVNPLPTATIAGDVTVCENDAAPDVTFTGANGTAPYTFTYTVDGGAPQTAVSDGTGVATVSQSTATAGTFTYDLVSVSDATATACSQVQTGTVIITVNPLPTATIAGDVEVCEGSADQVVTITGANGTIPYTFTYTLNGGAPQTVVSDGTGVATITQSAATAGTFTFDLVSVSDASATACSQAQTGTVVVTVNPLPTATISGTVEVCEGAADQTITFTGANGTAPYTFTYTLNGGAPTTVVSDGTGVATIAQPATTAGTYTYDLVSVEDATATACTQAQTGSAVVTVNPSPTATIAGDVEVCEGAVDQTITFTGGNGTAPYTFTYTIDGGAPQIVVSDGTGIATVTQTAGTAGVFTYDLVSVSDASVTACSQAQTGTVVVTVNPLPTATIAGTIEVCEGSADQTITLTGANGTAPYTFTYTLNGGAPQTVVSDGTGVATVTQSAATAGTFTFDLVDVTDATATACTQAQTGTAVITVNPLPTATVAGDVTICEGSADQTVTFTGANGTAPYTFTYTVNGGAPQTVVSDGTGVATVAQSAAAAGTFTYDLVSVEDATATACTQAQAGTVVVTVNPLPTATIAGDIEVCEGAADQTITFTGANGTAPYTFTYTVNGGAPQTVVSDATGVATVTQSAATAGSYAYDLVSVDDANLCSQAQTGTATVTVNPLPTATIAGDVTVCEGSADQTITLTGANGTAPYTFTYTVNGGAPQTVVSDGTGVATVTQTVTTAGTYAYDLVDVTDATASACTQLQTGTATVVVNPLPTATIAGDVAICEGSADQTVTFTGAGSTAPYTFTYTVNGGAPQTVVSDATGVATVTQSAAAAGTFTYDLVDVTDASATACTQAQAGTVIITVNPIPTISTVGTDPTVCNGTDGFVTVSGSSTNNVTVSWTGTATGSQAGVALPYDITGLGAGTYDVTYVDDVTGCGTIVSQSTLINPGAPILDPIANIVSCADQTLDINSVTGTDLVNPQYYSATGGPTGTGVLIPDGTTFTAFTDTTIFVYDVNGTCSNETQYTITVNTTPTLTLQDTTTCSPNTVDLGDVTYWSTDVGTMTWYSDAGLTTVLPSTTVGDGTYYVEADNLGCTSNGQVTVTVNTTPTLTLQDTTDCSPFTVDLSDVNFWSADVGTLTWYSDAGLTTVLPSTSVGAGTYYVEADNLGCTTSGSVVVTEITTPDVDPLGPIAECDSYTLPIINGTALSGTQAYYTGMGGTGTQFNAGDAITTSGLTTLYIYDGVSGCSDEEQLDITITVTPTITAADPAEVCEPNTVDISNAATSDVGTLTWYTDAGLTTPVVDPTQVTTGMYYVEADNNGCASNDVITVTVNPLPPAPTAGTDSTYCTSWTLENMTATGTGGTLNWYLDTLSGSIGTGGTYTPDMVVGTTDYYVTETLLGCEGPASMVTITIEECDITIPTAITPNGDLNNDNWEILNLDAVYPDNTVRVFNRWGNLIFEHISTPSAPYDQNRWDGTYDGDSLPVGSYYYVIELNDEDGNVETGSVSIILD